MHHISRICTLVLLANAFGFSLSIFGGESLPGFQGLVPTPDITCLTCRSLLATVKTMLSSGSTEEEVLQLAATTCITMNLFAQDVCNGMVQLAGPEVIYVLNNTQYDADTVCGFVLGGSHCTGDELESWNVTIPDKKPQVLYPIIPMTENTRKILHISDLHVDHAYEIGTPDECGHPLCCRSWGDEEQEGAEPAGFWGAKGTCDIPPRTLDLLLKSAAEHKPDIVYVTGDFPPHDVWAQDHSSNLASIDLIGESLMKAFPDTPVVMAVGNHESAPVNSFSLPSTYSSGFDMKWLYNHLVESWSQWVPESSRSTLKLGGFYSFSPFKGLVVVSMNTNFCNRLNWWLLLQNEDPTDELKWLIALLTIAETNGDKVHILGHIPPGSSDCEHGWSHAFNRIVTRFEATITAMFFGHHHHDQWQISWDVDDDQRPVAMSYLPPSVTSSGQKNPSYRFYFADGETGNSTWTVLDHESWSMNLTLANSDNMTDFTKTYTASSAYGLKTLSPEEWVRVTNSMATDDALFHEYLRHYYNYYLEPEEVSSCDLDCREKLLCKLVVSDSSNEEPCNRISDLIDGVTTETPSTTTEMPMDHSGHTTMDMDMGMDMDMSMSMSFHGGFTETIVFEGWKIDSVGGLIGSMVGIFLMALFYEGVKYFREYLFRRSVANLSIRGGDKQTVPSQERPVHLEMFSPDHGLQTILHMLQFLISYFLMLIFMTYNAWLCLAALLGSGTGYFLFGWRKSVVVDVTEHCH